MGAACKTLGAMFDERTLDCVYTVNFYAGDKSTLFASKKAYAGSTFNCDQNWFGIDVTTFKENAYRLTRSQTAASSAMLGSGVGTAVGSITSGALNRALDRQKAEKALKKAKDEGKSSEEEDSDNSKDEEDNSDEKECTKDENCGAGQTCTNGKCKAKDADKDGEWEIETNSEKIRQCDISLSTKPTAWGTGWCFFNPETDELTNTPVPEWFDAFCGSEEKMYQGCVLDPDDPTYADCKSYLEWRQKNPNVTCCELKKAAGNENEAAMCLHCSNAWHCMYGEGRPIKGECDNKSELLKDPKKYPMPC